MKQAEWVSVYEGKAVERQNGHPYIEAKAVEAMRQPGMSRDRTGVSCSPW